MRERFQEYHKLGARFAKWRAVIDIGPGIPTYNCINANAQALARYAALAQENGIVPIVEPEVLMDGDHDIAALRRRHQLGAARKCSSSSSIAEVALEGMILKPNMIVPGKKCAKQNSAAGSGRAHREGVEATTCRRRCRASPSCRAASRTRKPPRICPR